MSVLDSKLELSSEQAVTASAASTNVVDLTATAPNVGRGGTPLYLQVKCQTTADSSGNGATVTIELEDSADNSTFIDVARSVTHAEAAVTAGAILFTIALPPTIRRYVRVYYTIGVENLTAGKFDAYLTTLPNK